MRGILGDAGAAAQSCAIGSVKSMIGHTKCAAGVAGLIKASLALYHKILPATLHVEQPNARTFDAESPLYVNSETRPWLQPEGGIPRRAGVSAFGFGGTNFHAALEEYRDDLLPEAPLHPRWPAELYLWAAPDKTGLQGALNVLEAALDSGARPAAADLARNLAADFQRAAPGGIRLAIVAADLADLRRQLAGCCAYLERGEALPAGVHLCDAPPLSADAVALVFAGQGSQYPNMLVDLSIQFPELRRAWERADLVLQLHLEARLSSYVFPVPAFRKTERAAQAEALTRTDIAQPALGAAGMGLYRLLERLGLRGGHLAGHSYGEYVALCAAGVLSEDDLYRISYIRGRSILAAAQETPGTMAAASADEQTVTAAIAGIADVWPANLNSPRQTVLAGTEQGIAAACTRLEAAGIATRRLQVACAFHSALVAPAQTRLARALADFTLNAPQIPVYSNTNAAAIPTIRRRLRPNWLST
ncbi:MAG: acyltransferase domain-containing protein [Oscillochloris sp.]|nr:acyltransferase domain-containing protein [Oscillochloris sp.]